MQPRAEYQGNSSAEVLIVSVNFSVSVGESQKESKKVAHIFLLKIGHFSESSAIEAPPLG
jgi:hypothetical protein